jgi:diguanylate cyclase (GGDEF)-like protein/PAS domain S-box-containing protein
MKQRGRQLRRTLVVVVLLFVGGLLAISAYTLWRLRCEAVVNGLEASAARSRGFEDLLTQSLHVAELLAANTLAQRPPAADPRAMGSVFVATLSRAPFLRSMSLLNESGRIVASSNPANLGISVRTLDYLPAASGALEILRIGQPWAGRDFAGGRPSTTRTPVDATAPSFIPVTQTLAVGDGVATLLVALNPDYFINHLSQKLDADEGKVEVVRYDGTLLMSTDPAQLPGSLHEYVVSRLRLPEVEFGSFEQDYGDDRQTLTSFRASRLYPLVIVTHIRREFALRRWQTEARTLLSVVVPVLLLSLVLAFAFYRRQMQLTAQRARAQRLQRINATVFDASSEAMLITGLDAEIVSINPAFMRVTGYRPDELIGRRLSELLTDEGVAAFEAIVRRSAAAAADEAPVAPASIEVQQRCKDGSLIWTEILSTPEHDAQGAIAGYHRICRNITERKQMEDQVRQLAFHDPLTRLPNRRLLNDRLDQTMAASKRSGRHDALMFLDLDNFKALNDTHGHEFGDLLLIEAARRLKDGVREMDTVARFGGDEFVVMLSALSTDRAESTVQAEVVAEKIRTALSAPYVLTVSANGSDTTVRHHCTTSIGVVVFVNHELSKEDILKWADAAMYQAKASGRDAIRFHAAPAQ